MNGWKPLKPLIMASKKVKQIKGTSNQYAITFKRKGRMQMPLDFTVETTNRESLNLLHS